MGKSSSLAIAAASPRKLGYRFPAEWEPHAATWLSWPHNTNTWPDGLEPVKRDYARMAVAIARDEPVHLNVNDDAMEEEARYWLNQAGGCDRIQFHCIRTNDAWCRDHGAIVLLRADPASCYPPRIAVDWEYNAWGGKYPPYDDDNAVPSAMARALDIPCVPGGMVLEGGSIETNGQGVLLTTERCLLDPNRNPQLNREHIEMRLGATSITSRDLWERREFWRRAKMTRHLPISN